MDFLSKVMWKFFASPEVGFFAREQNSSLGHYLEERWSGFKYMLPLWEGEESCDHTFLHCRKTRNIWYLLFTLFGVSWVFPSMVKAVLLS